jgi:hypothetical protein
MCVWPKNSFGTIFWPHSAVNEFFKGLISYFDNFLCSSLYVSLTWNIFSRIIFSRALTYNPTFSQSASPFNLEA